MPHFMFLFLLKREFQHNNNYTTQLVCSGIAHFRGCACANIEIWRNIVQDVNIDREHCIAKHTLLTLTGTVPNKGNGSLLCFARFMEREIARKTETNVGGKWQCPLITQVKRSHIVYKSMSIAVGLDK